MHPAEKRGKIRMSIEMKKRIIMTAAEGRGLLIVEGNEVYELDEECLEEKKEQES